MSPIPKGARPEHGPAPSSVWPQAPVPALSSGLSQLGLSLPRSQDWVTSTELLVSLDRLNTFGDDIFKDPRVLQSYYYAVSDFSVGGR